MTGQKIYMQFSGNMVLTIQFINALALDMIQVLDGRNFNLAR